MSLPGGSGLIHTTALLAWTERWEAEMAVGIFAGIPVSDFGIALEWYQRLLGAEPTFYPNDVEAVWQLAEDRYVYIIQDANRAGGAVSMIWVDDPIAEVAGSPSEAWNRSASRSTIESGSTSSTMQMEMRPGSAGRFPHLNKSIQDQLTRPGGIAFG